jgi:hypothetical protein
VRRRWKVIGLGRVVEVMGMGKIKREVNNAE